MGFAWQLGLVWTLTAVWGLNYLAATLIAVEIVVVHNFFWHVSWTWSERDIVPREIAWRLARFNLTTGLLSIAGNVAVTAALVRLCGIHDLAANVIAIAACSSANFLVSHRVVFAPILCLMTMLASGAAHAADLSPAGSAAFDRDARLLESRLDDERAGKAPFLWIDRLADARQRDARARLAQGDIVVERPTAANPASPPPGAMLHHWMATALIAGASLDGVVRLMQGLRPLSRCLLADGQAVSPGRSRWRHVQGRPAAVHEENHQRAPQYRAQRVIPVGRVVADAGPQREHTHRGGARSRPGRRARGPDRSRQRLPLAVQQLLCAGRAPRRDLRAV
jgi:putative flippase GtrA